MRWDNINEIYVFNPLASVRLKSSQNFKVIRFQGLATSNGPSVPCVSRRHVTIPHIYRVIVLFLAILEVTKNVYIAGGKLKNQYKKRLCSLDRNCEWKFVLKIANCINFYYLFSRKWGIFCLFQSLFISILVFWLSSCRYKQ